LKAGVANFIVEKENMDLSEGLPTTTLTDAYNRQIDYLRISITDRCNLKCIYCMPEKNLKHFDRFEILTADEIIRIVRIAFKHGVRKVRLTGGEPLLRDDIIPLISGIKRSGILDLSITTNGQRLAGMAGALKKAGLDRVNVSLDTLIAQRYREITRGGEIDLVWEAIKEAELAGLSPVKINVVPVRGINDDEVSRFATLTLYKDVHIRFIEFMPIGNNGRWKPDAYLSKDEIMERASCAGKLAQLPFKGGGPSRNYRIEGAQGMIGFISPISDCFCASCNRLRLTAIGKLRPCLFSESNVDIKTPMRNGATDDELENLYRHAVFSKPARHALGEVGLLRPAMSPMSQIGG
jgi:GTP 3',8-cyclase